MRDVSVYATSAKRRPEISPSPVTGCRSSIARRATGGGAPCREVDESMKVDALLPLTCQTETRAFAVYASAWIPWFGCGLSRPPCPRSPSTRNATSFHACA